MPVFLAAFLFIAMPAEPAGQVVGVVVDAGGKGVANASIRLEIAGRAAGEGRTAADGRFGFLTDLAGDVRLTVTAPGFAPAVVVLEDGPARAGHVTLELTALFEEVQVTPPGDLLQADPDVSALVFSVPPLRTRAAMTIDDTLKMVPGFTLGRRSSSRVANPGSQGLTLRGLGASGASRSAVLTDGVPLNDAFAGWVYWDKVPQSAIDRIEVLKGGGSDRDATGAVGGVVQIVTIRPGRASVRALVEGGSLGTGRLSLFAGRQRAGWSVSGAGEWFATEGYVMVPEGDRGPIDTPAGSRHRSAFTAIGYQAPGGWRFDARGNLFSEDRRSGTPAQANDTSAGHASGEVAGIVGGGFLSARLYGVATRFAQTFSVISAEPPRASEDLSRIDDVPTQAVGGAAQWAHQLGRHSLTLGGEGRAVNGRAATRHLAFGDVLETSTVDGRQRAGSAFARATFALNDRLTVAAGARAEVWHSESGETGAARQAGSLSPRASFSYRLGTGVTLRGAVYRGFRAPTLNELYRGFRVGYNVTEPNDALRPERLTAREGAIAFSQGRASVRVTVYWNELDDVITNVTLSTSPWLNIRQRQNAGTLRSKGLEFEGAWRLPHSVFVGVTGALIDSRFADDTRLAQNFVPQVPAYSAGLTTRYDNGVWTVSGQFRLTGPQFEDDVNSLTLRRAAVVDLLASRTIARNLNAFFAVENALDSDYDVGRTPTRTIGLPRALRAGIQLAW